MKYMEMENATGRMRDEAGGTAACKVRQGGNAGRGVNSAAGGKTREGATVAKSDDGREGKKAGTGKGDRMTGKGTASTLNRQVYFHLIV